MNSPQLIVLWYAVVLASLSLVVFALGDIPDWATLISLLFSIGLVAAALIYSFSNSVRADQRIVAKVVIGPILLVVAIWGLNEWSKTWKVSIPESGVTITDTRLFEPSYSSSTITGRISNTSDRHLREVILRVMVYDSARILTEARTETLRVDIAAGATTQLRESVYFGRNTSFPDPWTWNWDLIVARANFRE